MEIVGDEVARFFISLLEISFELITGSEKTSLSSAVIFPVSSSENSLKSIYLILSVILGLGFYLLISYLIKAFQLEDIKLRY